MTRIKALAPRARKKGFKKNTKSDFLTTGDICWDDSETKPQYR